MSQSNVGRHISDYDYFLTEAVSKKVRIKFEIVREPGPSWTPGRFLFTWTASDKPNGEFRGDRSVMVPHGETLRQKLSLARLAKRVLVDDLNKTVVTENETSAEA